MSSTSSFHSISHNDLQTRWKTAEVGRHKLPKWKQRSKQRGQQEYQNHPCPRNLITSSHDRQIKPDTICILHVSRFGSNDDTPSNVLNHHVEVSTHEPGGVNTVSARFLSVFTGKPIGEYLAMVGNREEEEKCFFKIEWMFPGHETNGPKITTRHLLLLTTESTSTPDLSFSGGLDWAKKLLEQVVTSSSLLQPNMQPDIITHVPPTPGSRIDVKNQRSELIHSEASSATTTTTTITAGESIDYYNHDTNANTSVPGSGHEEQQPQHPITQSESEIIIESLKEQRKQAEALYARNGDMSEMMALVARAKNIPEAWEPNGRARF